MDDISSGLDPDELMDLEDPEPYDLDEEEEEIPDESATSPFQNLSSGPASAATSAASSPFTTDDFSPPFNVTGKPLTIKRGRGRPRREGGKPPVKRGGGGGAPRVRRAKPIGLSRYRGSRSARVLDRMDFDLPYISPTSLDDLSLIDGDGFFFPERERSAIFGFEDIPYAPETWPGKVCAFCNLGERSQLGQGEIVRLNCPEGFSPQRMSLTESNSNTSLQVPPEKDSEDKSPRGPVTCRRTKNFSRSRSFVSNNEHIDELTIIGYTEQPSVNILFEPNGQFYVHRSCALWSDGVIKTENQALENVGSAVLKSSSKKCSFCNHYGASLVCKTIGCSKNFHFPCSTASGAFQDITTLSVYCNNHLGEAAMRSDAALCNTCKNVGDIANLIYCSVCGTHYHGSCVGLAQLPGVRAGWQCRKCRICQVCRVTGDESKLMTCEQCDKVYHASCQRPMVTSIPKYGWKCRCCRVCGDCGSRTPGAGLSSRWHLHYTVCDSCYQQRNKGCCCPICQRAYRSHAHREMVQCTMCRKFVHGTCDSEADVTTYQQKRDSNPDYEYVCVICKNMSIQQQLQLPGRQLTSKRSSTDDPGDLSASQESLYDDMSEFDSIHSDDSFRCMGLGKGKPYASKIAKKRLSYSTGMPGRPKGSFGKGYSGKQSFMKRQRFADFGRKRGPKAKIRGVFGVPGVGLSRPVADGKGDEEPGVENRLVLCSAKDKFVLTQDICVMCGALGTDQEGCLIACVQCGQCYHPYCINVKVTKVVLQKGWRCLDCTVCEGCGQRNDEGRLILCDDCDVSYHTYCMDPPLDYVPHGNWKCKWCACCRTCGAADPGFNCTWMNGCTECGPCASHTTCPSCGEPYCEGDLIIQCVQCERWLHGPCDLIKTDQDAEKCAEEGYTCLLCRPRDVPPPHLIPTPAVPKPPTPTKSPEVRPNANFFVDGVCLNESGHSLIKSLSLEYHGTRKKRRKVPTVQDKEAGIMATIESVVAGGSAGDNSLEDTKIEMVDIKDEPQELYKEGMIWTKEDGQPPEGFTIFTMESGICVLRRKRQRNLQKLGIGGFLVRMRGFRNGQENDDIDTLPGQTTPTGNEFPMSLSTTAGDGDKPKKKPIRRKPKCKLAETFPSYLQEAFFGKDLLDVTDFKKEMESGSSDEEKGYDKHHAIRLSAEELMAVETAQQDRSINQKDSNELLESIKEEKSSLIKDEEEENTEDLKDVLALPGDLLDTDLVNSIINEEDDELTKNTELETLGDDGELTQTLGSGENSKDAKDELSDILGSHFTLESIPNINSKDVEDIFKGVLTDESQESQLSQESTMFSSMQTAQTPMFTNNVSLSSSASVPQMPLPSAPVRPSALPGVQHVSFPASPYHSEYNSPQFSPAFSEPPSPWVNINDGVEIDSTNVGVPSTYNQRSSEKMKADEGLGSGATISAVLYANMNHAEWKTEFPVWSDRYKQIIKKWRTLTQDQKAPYLQQARDNRSQLRMKKQQQSQNNKDTSTPSPSMPVKPPLATPPVVTSLPSPGPTSVIQAQPTSELASEVCNPQRTPAQPLTRASTCSVSISSHRSTSSPPHSPPTHQQFTVHGQFAGPGDRVGPAPNVTVNPNYHPNPVADHAPLLSRSISVTQQSSSPSASDQQIRVLTPSEIMRTLPSLCQESYEPQQPDQEKITQQQKSIREAEQERQWKQLQAMRQQQAQQQQHVIHEQRVQAIARVQRTISEPAASFVQSSQTSPLQVSTSPEVNPAASPSSGSLPFIGIKSSPFQQSSTQLANIPTPSPSQSPVLEFQQPQKSQTPDSVLSEAYVETPTTPKPTSFSKATGSAGNESVGQPYTAPGVAPARSSIHVRPEQPEITRQLRDLLQRQQQLKNLDLSQEKGSKRIWNPNDSPETETPTSGVVLGENNTFRQPLPPGSSRPRIPLSLGIRPGLNIRMQQVENRLQGADPRKRLILQQQQRSGVPGQQQLTSSLRFVSSGSTRPATIEQYEQLLQRQAQLQARNTAMEQCSNSSARLPLVQTESSVVQKPNSTEQTSLDRNAVITQRQSRTNSEQEIPDNVTAELEKLEQETGTMAELQGVSEILGGLGDDDDELLAEMGADFNILEYADPELEALAGEKTNILDLDLEDDNLKQERKKEALQQKQNMSSLQRPTTTGVTTAPTTTCSTPSEEIRTGPLPSSNLPNTPNPEKHVETQPPDKPVLQQQQPKTLNDNAMSQQSHQSSSATQPVPDAASQSTQTIPPSAPTHISNPQVTESPPIQQSPPQQLHPAFTTQQIHQQMLHQVQQAAAQGRPMPPGSKLQTPDGIVGIVLANNNVQLQIPPNFQHRLLLQLQNQKLQMRVGRTPSPRILSHGLSQPQQAISGPVVRPRLALSNRPPPPPPYPGPPPPYPGNVISQQQAVQQQMGLRMGPGVHHHMGLMHPMALQGFPMHLHFQRRPLLIEEQPLLLEDLLEQEKREQEKQQQTQPSTIEVNTRGIESESTLLTDQDFERLRADVFSGGNIGVNRLSQGNSSNISQQHWQQNKPASSTCPQPTTEITTRVQMFNANLLPAPPLPPESIVTEQDKQAQLVYEQWLNHQNNVLTQQLRYYETEVQKLRKGRKSLNSKQRQLRKSGNQLSEADSNELQRISAEQAILQKHLESSRKQSRQHGMLIQEYRNKQQPHKPQASGPTAQISSPLGPPASSPIHHSAASQSPMLSPQQSPLAHHVSPMNSPGPIVAHSPGPGSVAALLQSPGGSVSPLQPSPRIGTPLSQGEGSPGPVQSPSQTCLPPPVPRMTSPQHRRVVTSPVGYSGDVRSGTAQMRFVRPPVDHSSVQPRLRNQAPSPMQNFPSKVGTPSPLNSPPLNQMSLVQQQLLHKQIHQQALLQQHQQNSEESQSENVMHSPRVAQLIQHRNLTRHQQISPSQGVIQPQPLTPQQHQLMVQQQQQLAKQQQQITMQLQARLNQQTQQSNPPQSPIPPKSPLHSQQILSPHSVPTSPMPPKSPMMSFNTNQQSMPNSPVSRNTFQQNTNISQHPSSPMMHQYQTPTSPMIHSPHAIRRPPSASSSPAMPEGPTSVENPSTPRTPYNMDNIQEHLLSGGGNPHNPNNPIPFPFAGFGKSGYFKLGLRGGSPMWSGFGRGEKRVPTPPTSTSCDGDKPSLNDPSSSSKPKKEYHINKVSILKKKVPLPRSGPKPSTNKICSDFSDYNDSSASLTPPPLTLTGRITGQNIMTKQESIDEKQIHVTEIVDYDDDNSTILSSEVSLSSAAQQNDDEMEMAETLSQSDIGKVLSSPMEADRISDDYLLFQENMVVDISGGVQYSDKEEVDEEYANIVIRSPTTSDDEFIMQGRTKKYNILNIAETSGSPDQDANTEPEDEDISQTYEESEVVIIDQPVKSPDEQISTKEDFEELIDEGSRKEKLKYEAKHTTGFHKFAATSVYSFPPKAQSTTVRPTNVITSKLPQKISLITTAPIIQNFTARSDPLNPNSEPQQLILTPNTKISTTTTGSKLTSIILTHNSVRSNILSVGPKIVSSSPGITIVSASTSQIASILPSKFTVPVISASAVRQLPNVKVIDKPSSSLSLTTHDSSLPKKIFDDDSVSPDNLNFDDERKSSDKSYKESSPASIKLPMFTTSHLSSNKTDEVRVNQAAESPKPPPTGDNGNNKNQKTEGSSHLIQNQLTHIVNKEKVQRLTKSSPPVVIHHASPELKMTAQVIQETPTHMQITATETVSTFDGTTEDKSVVISIPSPTPSQEQMLDNIALQALENRRREFDSFEDVLDMIENMQNPDSSDQIGENQDGEKQGKSSRNIEIKKSSSPSKEPSKVQMDMNATNTSKQSIPQLSPLSQPTELTTNMANASQQLRSLLSSLQTTTSSSTSNVETMVKSSNQKLSSSSMTTSPIFASRVIQQAVSQSSVLTNASTVIVPNTNKQKLATSLQNRANQSSGIQISNTVTASQTTPVLSFIANRTTSTADSPKFITRVTSQPTTIQPTTTIGHSTPSLQKSSVISSVNLEVNKKVPLSLTAMLQNQPAATFTTKSSADTITAASLLATPVSLSRTSFSPALAQAQPNAIVAAAMKSNSSTTTSITTNSVITSPFRAITSTTNLLHTQLTKSRTKSLDDLKELKVDESVKLDKSGIEPDILSSVKQELGGCKYSSIPTPSLNNKCDDSQNVLLKQLLQNAACASTQSNPPNTTPTTALTPSADPQKSSPPTLSSLLPPVMKTEPQSLITTQSRPSFPRGPIRETSFVSSPIIQQAQTITNNSVPTQQLHIDIKKCAPPSRSSSRDDILSPPTPRSSCSQDSSLQTPPLTLKKESINFLGNTAEIKKEMLDETSQHSEISDQGKLDIQIKEELESGDTVTDKAVLDKEELKKQKRRMYNQKRRQNQILNKDVNKPNKRPRKNSKLDEDYDSYIDSVLAQIRHLPAMIVSEPILLRNYGVMPIFDSGDLSKIGTKWFDSRYGDLTGTYGNAVVPSFFDFYNTKPYGDEEPLPEKPPASTQRGFYDQEFPLIRFDTEDDKKFDLFSRDNTPDSVVSSSSPECLNNTTDASDKYIGLKLISDDEEDDSNGRISPDIPIIKPIPIRPKIAGLYLTDSKMDIDDKENIFNEIKQDKLRPGFMSSTPLKENENIKVTLTLTSSAAEDIVGVLRDLANILQIPPPSTYQIIDRTSSPSGQKLGMYRTKGRDGKEGAPIDIQSILNGAAKFCKHCDVVILNNMIRKKVSDLSFLAKDSELLSEGEELYFCSSACYMQFALMHRSPLISEDKAAAIIDHLSLKDKHDYKHHRLVSTEFNDQNPTVVNRMSLETKEIKTEESSPSLFTSYFHPGFKQMSKFGVIRPVESTKIHKNVTYKFWAPGCLYPNQKHKKPTDKEMMEMLYQMSITVTPPKMPDDTRRCMFCQVIGDGVADGPARLLNFDVDKWVHLNCALWSDGVYETVNGALMNLENSIQQSLTTMCIHCGKRGATIQCFKTRCSSVYHLSCAVRDNCVFFKNKTVYCTVHVPKNEKDNELTTLSVGRRVYVNRDENRQVAAVMHHSDTNNLLRVGSLIFLNVGQLLPHQLQNFHNSNFIYPIGYKIIRFYWSMRYINKRCRYICSINDSCGRPEFKVLVQEYAEDDVEFKDNTSKEVWTPILEKIAAIRRENNCLQMFPKYISGEDLFGLTEPAIVRVLESLPGIETLTDYKFKYGRNPLLELPLAINPTGAARTEPRLRHQTHWKRPHTQRTTGSSSRPLFGPSPSGSSTPTGFGEIICPYSKQFVHSKSSQYKKMKQEWRNNVYLARSKIQGLGLYAARDLEKHTMVIEYIGEVIRTELSECREKQYEAKNRGIYMFRLDDDRVVDATLSGGLARYINHSCNPNCVAETVEIDRDLKIIIFAKRRIQRGEELAYDYKFDIEDDQNKISCMCGAPNCRKWMN